MWQQNAPIASRREWDNMLNDHHPMNALPAAVGDTLTMLGSADYVADRSLATVLYLALRMGRPLFVEGEAGVGKTEIAKVLSATLGRRLIRLQCYEGLDISSAVYEWNYGAQMIAIRLAEAEGEVAIALGVANRERLFEVRARVDQISHIP